MTIDVPFGHAPRAPGPVRRHEERVPAGHRGAPGARMGVSASDLAREIEELIAALDRRVPRVERSGEATIARDAAALRATAVQRLADLSAPPPPAVDEAPQPDDRAGVAGTHAFLDESR